MTPTEESIAIKAKSTQWIALKKEQKVKCQPRRERILCVVIADCLTKVMAPDRLSDTLSAGFSRAHTSVFWTVDPSGLGETRWWRRDGAGVGVKAVVCGGSSECG